LHRITGGSPPRAEQLSQLEYLDAAIRESLRLRTIFPFVVRLTKRPFQAGVRDYPAGVILCPEQFRPERFAQRKYLAHEWFPFGGGNRMCLGMAFALYEMKVVLSTLFAQVHLSRPDGARSRPVRQGVALAPDDGVPMIVKKSGSS
jgi:cytochrome P450